MSAVLPLIGGLLLGRFVKDLRVAAAIQVAFYAIAAALLISSAPDHGASHTQGAVLALVLAPVSVATLYLGTMWRHRSSAVGQPAGNSVR
ncbi:MAG: hypothetical protein ABI658_23115 [Acidimicrobiales bacterium]